MNRSVPAVEICGTLGPACADEEILTAMIRNGMTALRLNLSHTTLRAMEPQVRMAQRAAERCGAKLRLLMDMQGPEVRIGDLPAPLPVAEGDRIRLGEGGIPVPAEVLPHLLPGQEALLDDGKIALAVTASHGAWAEARAVRDGILQRRKSLALPGCEIRLPAMTAEDLENLALAKGLGIRGLMQPFVRGGDDLRAVRAAAEAAGYPELPILAKIENRSGVASLPELLPLSDEIVIARGDLGNAIPLWELIGVQKDIAAACRAAGVPFVVVNQMLASMEENPVPTRAEMSDIFNAVLDGASMVMLTGETAAGKHPAEAILYMARAVREAEAYVSRI